MDKRAWIIAGVLSVLMLLGIIGLASRQNRIETGKARAESAAAQEQIAKAAAETEKAKQETAALKEQLDEARAANEQLRKEKEFAAANQKSLEQEMRAALESKDVTISELQGRLTVNILDRVLFDSGEAVLKPDGERVLRQVAGVLAQFPNRLIHVAGHTDNVPLKPGARFASNWELSTARANSAVRFLSEKAGVEPKRLASVGYGEFHPIADNAAPDGRAKNRRIELVVMPEDLVKPAPKATPALEPSAAEKPKQ
ncbi:MAG: OmpA family protein [Verrucomicrobia bacterium]|nr:OmpA family protein [Verrucomicrobiota bacterium]